MIFLKERTISLNDSLYCTVAVCMCMYGRGPKGQEAGWLAVCCSLKGSLQNVHVQPGIRTGDQISSPTPGVSAIFMTGRGQEEKEIESRKINTKLVKQRTSKERKMKLPGQDTNGALQICFYTFCSCLSSLAVKFILPILYCKNKFTLTKFVFHFKRVRRFYILFSAKYLSRLNGCISPIFGGQKNK